MVDGWMDGSEFVLGKCSRSTMYEAGVGLRKKVPVRFQHVYDVRVLK